MTAVTKELLDSLAGVIKEYVQSELGPLRTRIAELESTKEIDEARIKSLEAREYQGTWDALKSYEKGAMVSWGGSCWHARLASRGRKPNEAHDCWQLMVKKGSDAKDQR
jgi:hypothetical protein